MVTRENCLFQLHEKLLRGTGVPDTCLEFHLVWKLDFLHARFIAVRVNCILNFIHYWYIGNGGLVSTVPTLALLVLKTAKYSIFAWSFSGTCTLIENH